MTEPTPAAAPSAPAKPVPRAAPAPKALPPNPLDASFSSRIAAAKNMGSPARAAVTATKAPASPVVAESVAESVAETDPEGTDPGEGETPPELEEPGPDSIEDDTADEAPVPGTDAEKVSTGLALMTKGDLEAAVRALGGDPKAIPLPTKKAFRAMARRELKAQAEKQAFDRAKANAHTELSTESNRLSQQQRALATRYAPADDSRTAWDNEDFLACGKALEKHFKTDLATITQKLASGKVGKTPDEKSLSAERAALAKERAEFEAAKAKESGAKTLASKREAAITRVGEGLKAHPFIAGTDGKTDPEALEEVFSAYEKAWDGEKFTKTAKQCADELQSKLEARAAKRGLVKAEAVPPPVPGKNGKPGVLPRQRIAEPPRTAPRTDLGTAADLDATRAQRLALAKRVTEQQRRGVR
jgi:hypothetical protein